MHMAHIASIDSILKVYKQNPCACHKQWAERNKMWLLLKIVLLWKSCTFYLCLFSDDSSLSLFWFNANENKLNRCERNEQLEIGKLLICVLRKWIHSFDANHSQILCVSSKSFCSQQRFNTDRWRTQFVTQFVCRFVSQFECSMRGDFGFFKRNIRWWRLK